MTATLNQPNAGIDFELEDHLGRPTRLHDGESAVTLLIFFRGHWCPYCRRYLAKLESNWPKFVERNVRLLAISPEPVPTSRALVENLGLSFPVLSDPSGAVIDRFGTRNGPSSASTVLPHPAIFILDAGGVIQFRKVDRNFKRRTTMHRIFTEIDRIALR